MAKGKRAQPSVHELADQLLVEVGRPLDGRTIAEELLRRGLITSNAREPWYSLATTIDKNIRDNRYNEPKLAFVLDAQGRPVHGKTGRRLVQRADWLNSQRNGLSQNNGASASVTHQSHASAPAYDHDAQLHAGPPDTTEEDGTLLLRVSNDVLKYTQLAQLAGLGATQEDAAILLLRRGINVATSDIGGQIQQRYLSGGV